MEVGKFAFPHRLPAEDHPAGRRGFLFFGVQATVTPTYGCALGVAPQ